LRAAEVVNGSQVEGVIQEIEGRGQDAFDQPAGLDVDAVVSDSHESPLVGSAESGEGSVQILGVVFG